MKRGDVEVIDHPFSDGGGRKLRPVLVVQSDSFNAMLTDTIVALITSRLHRSLPTHVDVDPSSPEGRSSGLRLVSRIQCENLYTIDQRFVLRIIGSLPRSVLSKVDECLRRSLAL